MKLIFITIGIATTLPMLFHWSKHRRIAIIVAGTTWAFFIAPTALVLSIMSFHAVIAALGPPCFMPASYHVNRIAALMSSQETNWSTVDKRFEKVKQCKSNKRHLANLLLSNEDGTAVALGMNIVVEETFDDGDALLKQHHGDMRWNYYLSNSDEYSKFMLALWKMKRDIPLTLTEREKIEGWSNPYFEQVGLIPPVLALQTLTKQSADE
jgi:hypothetical protein